MLKSIKPKNTFSPVDILIPYHGCYHLLGKCLESIITKTLGIVYTITVIDDCSPNKEFITDLEKHKLKKMPLQYIRHDKHEGFGAALQTGFNKTQNNWIVFLHTDCQIEQTDWLINMLHTMQSYKKDGVKLVSAKMNNGGLGAYDEKVLGSQDKGQDCIAEQPLPLVCALVNRQLFNHIGGFIKPYYPFAGEDLELFWRMKLHNFKQAICGSSFVHHIGGASIKTGWQHTQKIFDDNEKLFTQDIQEYAKKKR